MKKILIIDGPNLNLLGRREPKIYGTQTTADMLSLVRAAVAQHTLPPTVPAKADAPATKAVGLPIQAVEVAYYQSNHEGAIIDKIHEAGFDPDLLGIVLNAGAYTHTSLAIADAIAAIPAPVVEVHISNVAARPQAIRHTSLIAPVCYGTITGFGLRSYLLAALALLG